MPTPKLHLDSKNFQLFVELGNDIFFHQLVHPDLASLHRLYTRVASALDNGRRLDLSQWVLLRTSTSRKRVRLEGTLGRLYAPKTAAATSWSIAKQPPVVYWSLEDDSQPTAERWSVRRSLADSVWLSPETFSTAKEASMAMGEISQSLEEASRWDLLQEGWLHQSRIHPPQTYTFFRLRSKGRSFNLALWDLERLGITYVEAPVLTSRKGYLYYEEGSSFSCLASLTEYRGQEQWTVHEILRGSSSPPVSGS